MYTARSSRFARKSTAAILLLLSVVLLLVGAGAVPLSFAQEEETIVGEFSVSIVRADIPTDQPDGFNYVGKWIINFNEDGTYTARRQDVGLLVSGSWEVTGETVTITDEEGIVSCTNPTAVTIPGEDTAAGTYTWSRNADELQLTLQEDSCGGRVILLSTHPLGPYVPCTVDPIDTAELDATEEALPVGSPEAAVDEVLTPNDPVSGTRGGNDQATPPVAASPESDAQKAAVTAEIDNLLGQMTSCWSTGDPDLWLALLSTDFRTTLIGSDPNFLTTIQAAMSVPIIWERAGDIEIDSPESASAIVRTTVDQEQDFQRFLFVLESGEWRWDG